MAQMSAPWLVLPFVVGMTQERPRKATVLGFVATAGALIGYFAMTYSPMEVHPWSLDRFTTGVVAIATSVYNQAYILGGMATGRNLPMELRHIRREFSDLLSLRSARPAG